MAFNHRLVGADPSRRAESATGPGGCVRGPGTVADAGDASTGCRARGTARAISHARRAGRGGWCRSRGSEVRVGGAAAVGGDEVENGAVAVVGFSGRRPAGP